MPARFKPLAEQVIVVTGAGSALGLAVARRAAKAGAAVVLNGRDEVALRAACEQIQAGGGRAHAVSGDPTSADGAERISRAAAARFGRYDTWIDAEPGLPGFVAAAAAAQQHFAARGGAGALVGFGSTLNREAHAALRRAGAVAATIVRLPRDWRHDSPPETAAAAALHAAVHPLGRLDLAPGGQRLSALGEAQKHRGVLLGAGVLALAAGALWLSRGRLAAVASPVIAKALRRGVVEAARRRPLQTARLAVRHPRQALRLARAAWR